MDIFSMMDEKSKQNVRKMLKNEKKNDIEHFNEYHFRTADEFVSHIRKGKRAYRGNSNDWISLDKRNSNMVVSSIMDRKTGKMEFTYEPFETFKAYASLLEQQSKNGFIEFWHKKNK